MADIVVVRGTDRKSHKLAQDNDSYYTLVKLRVELQSNGLMFENDMFKNGATNSTIAGGKSVEENYYIGEIFNIEEKKREVGIVPGDASTQQITVVKGNTKNAIQYDTNKTLLDFRNYLRSKNWIAASDRFSTVGGAPLALEAEDGTLVKDIIKGGEVKVVPGKPSSEIIVEKGDEKKSYTVEDTTTLAIFRQTLIKDQVMKAGEG
ncbi:MAG: hypothetical protein ACRD2B_16775 [Terriglobia bacterium]